MYCEFKPSNKTLITFDNEKASICGKILNRKFSRRYYYYEQNKLKSNIDYDDKLKNEKFNYESFYISKNFKITDIAVYYSYELQNLLICFKNNKNVVKILKIQISIFVLDFGIDIQRINKKEFEKYKNLKTIKDFNKNTNSRIEKFRITKKGLFY